MNMTSPNIATRAYRLEAKSQCLSGCGSFGGASAGRAIRLTSTTGTLMRKTEPHQKCSSSAPPMTGPAAAPSRATDAHTPMAVLSSFGSRKVWRTSARVAGIIVAAPSPSRARAATNAQALGAKAAAREARPKMTRPTVNIRRWPILSPRVPVPRRKPASTSG